MNNQEVSLDELELGMPPSVVLVRRGGVHDLTAEHCEQGLDGANLFDGHGHIVLG